MLLRITIVFCFLVAGLLPAAPLAGATEQTIAPLPPKTRQTLVPPPAGIQAFHPGETLTYTVSWSKMFSAGTVTMTVERSELPEGREGLKFIVRGRTQGMVDKVFPVNDEVQSVFDPKLMQSLSYSLKESYSRKKRLRTTEFDHAAGTAVCRLNEDPPETVTATDPVQDGLSLIYFLRTQDNLAIGRRMEIDVVDSGKNWTMEVTVLTREKVETAAGKFDTIRIRTSPADKEGRAKKREVFLWLTDDARKIPVLMKSTLKVGSFVFELAGMQPGIHRITQ